MRFSVRLLALLATFLPAVLSFREAFAEQTWTEVRSPHFRVITNGSSRDGRAVANEFEQMRYVFALRFKNASCTDNQLHIGLSCNLNFFRGC